MSDEDIKHIIGQIPTTKGCEYCDGEEPRKAIYCAAGNTIGIPKENMLIMQRDSTTYIWTRINYCPMCGRNLG